MRNMFATLAFRYPFNNRLHRALHSDESRSLLDVMPDQWYVARPRPLNPLWGKSGPERLVEGANIRGEEQILSNKKHLEDASTNLENAKLGVAEAQKNLTKVKDKIRDTYVNLKEVSLKAKELDGKAGEKMDQIREQQRAVKKLREQTDRSEEDNALMAQRMSMLKNSKGSSTRRWKHWTLRMT